MLNFKLLFMQYIVVNTCILKYTFSSRSVQLLYAYMHVQLLFVIKNLTVRPLGECMQRHNKLTMRMAHRAAPQTLVITMIYDITLV